MIQPPPDIPHPPALSIPTRHCAILPHHHCAQFLSLPYLQSSPTDPNPSQIPSHLLALQLSHPSSIQSRIYPHHPRDKSPRKSARSFAPASLPHSPAHSNPSELRYPSKPPVDKPHHSLRSTGFRNSLDTKTQTPAAPPPARRAPAKPAADRTKQNHGSTRADTHSS